MTNDMIAMASNWEERLGPQKEKRKMTHKFGVFSREIFPFSSYFLLHVHTGLNFQTGMYEHAKVQLLLIKFNARTPEKNIP